MARTALTMGTATPCNGPVAVVGGGIIGSVTAWWLSVCGAEVIRIDPGCPQERASLAALGVLMGHCSHRRTGRSWRLRQASLALWHRWIPQLEAEARQPVKRQWGLTVLGHGRNEADRLQTLIHQRRKQGVNLTWHPAAELVQRSPGLASRDLQGGLWSPRDGRLDPASLLAALAIAAERRGVQRCRARVTGLRRRPNSGWQLKLEPSFCHLDVAVVVLCNGLAATSLANAAQPCCEAAPAPGTSCAEQAVLAMEPVLGQAAELHGPEIASAGLSGPVVWQGVNLVPVDHETLWLGATVEPGQRGNGCTSSFNHMLGLHGTAPDWLAQATIRRRWQGVRARPVGRAAPLLEQLAPGLLLTTGHYRNGILLAPATAWWTADQLNLAAPGNADADPAIQPICFR